MDLWRLWVTTTVVSASANSLPLNFKDKKAFFIGMGVNWFTKL